MCLAKSPVGPSESHPGHGLQPHNPSALSKAFPTGSSGPCVPRGPLPGPSPWSSRRASPHEKCPRIPVSEGVTGHPLPLPTRPARPAPHPPHPGEAGPDHALMPWWPGPTSIPGPKMPPPQAHCPLWVPWKPPQGGSSKPPRSNSPRRDRPAPQTGELSLLTPTDLTPLLPSPCPARRGTPPPLKCGHAEVAEPRPPSLLADQQGAGLLQGPPSPSRRHASRQPSRQAS